MDKARPYYSGLLLAVLLSTVATGCSSSLVGTGDDAPPIHQPNTNSQPPAGDDPTSSQTADDGNTVGASGAPTKVEALFLPPTTDKVTPDSIFGLWAGSGSSIDERMMITSTEFTIAKKCKSSGKIAYATVKIRSAENGKKITFLEAKSDKLDYDANDYSCYSDGAVNVDVGEWEDCSTGGSYSACYQLDGNKLRDSGAALDWLKLSD